MSRVDEALQRAAGGDEATPGMQQLFRPAWSDAELEPDPPAASPVFEHHAPGERQETIEPIQLALSAGPIRFSSRWREQLAAGPAGDPVLVEQFRRLATTLHHAQQVNGLRSIMVTSAMPGDGKTLTAINLGLVLAESYRANVLIVDADLRRASISELVEPASGGGLSDALRSSTEQKLALLPLTPRLTLLPAGQPIANSIEALTSPRMQRILDEAATRYDWVILDAPPLGPAADATLLTRMVGGVLFVVRAGRTRYADVAAAVKSIGSEQIIGVVLNGVEDTPTPEYSYLAGPRD